MNKCFWMLNEVFFFFGGGEEFQITFSFINYACVKNILRLSVLFTKIKIQNASFFDFKHIFEINNNNYRIEFPL